MKLHADAAITPEGVVFDAEVSVEGDRITYVGPQLSPKDEATQLPGQVLLPGFVNAHTHSAMTLLRGADDDHGFMPWLAEVQALEQHLTHEDVEAGLGLAMLEMISTGTTAFADMYVWTEALIEQVKAAGMRVYAAHAVNAADGNMFPGVTSRNGREELGYACELAAKYAGDPQVRIGFGPHAPYSVTTEFWREIIETARAHSIPIHTHVSESPAEVADALERFGDTPADYLGKLGIFDTDLLAAHCVHFTESEIRSFAERGAALSHNPVSNMKLGNGVAPLTDFIAAGVRVGIGTDSVASNNSLDMFEEVKFSTILHRGVQENAAAVQAAKVLELASNGDAIGFPDAAGIAAGKLADLVAVAVSDLHNPVSEIAFAANGHRVKQVWIGGRHVYRDGEFLTLDEHDIRQRAAASMQRLRAAAGS